MYNFNPDIMQLDDGATGAPRVAGPRTDTSKITQEEKLEKIGGLPGKPYRQKYGEYAKKLLKETIPNLFEEIPVPSEVQGDVVKEMWIQLGVQNA